MVWQWLQLRVPNGGCAVSKTGSSGIAFALNNTQGKDNCILSSSTGLTYQFDSTSIPSAIVPENWYQLKLRVTNEDTFASIDGTLVSHIPFFEWLGCNRIAMGSCAV